MAVEFSAIARRLGILSAAGVVVMVALMVAVHAWAPPHAKALSLTALVFMGLLAGVTCSLHFVILTLSPAWLKDAVSAKNRGPENIRVLRSLS